MQKSKTIITEKAIFSVIIFFFTFIKCDFDKFN